MQYIMSVIRAPGGQTRSESTLKLSEFSKLAAFRAFRNPKNVRALPEDTLPEVSEGIFCWRFLRR